MTERKMRMITTMFLVWSALYLMAIMRAHSKPVSIGGGDYCSLGGRQTWRIGGTS
jgi:hypothetical protein